MKYESKEVLEVIKEIDKALEFIASSVDEESKALAGTLVATPLYLSQHVLTITRNFLAKEGGAR
mgnify:CR=1 FL=1|tara:strand:+ start:182 stop:373 length:192 start_codon:yes stop_codon:yes gene_type:complete